MSNNKTVKIEVGKVVQKNGVGKLRITLSELSIDNFEQMILILRGCVWKEEPSGTFNAEVPSPNEYAVTTPAANRRAV